MRDCARDVKLSSQLPDYARNDHGNLAEQTRPIGPDVAKRAGGAATPSRGASTAAAARVADAVTRADLAKSTGCTACHGVTQKVVGPAFREIGGRYAGDAGAAERLAHRVRQGSTGAWGPVPMPAQSQVSDADARTLVRWILDGAR
jgi:cytochrome c